LRARRAPTGAPTRAEKPPLAAVFESCTAHTPTRVRPPPTAAATTTRVGVARVKRQRAAPARVGRGGNGFFPGSVARASLRRIDRTDVAGSGLRRVSPRLERPSVEAACVCVRDSRVWFCGNGAPAGGLRRCVDPR
jgi:hypothetical protein